MTRPLVEHLQANGFALAPQALVAHEVEQLRGLLEDSGAASAARERGGCRHLLERAPGVLPLLTRTALPAICRQLLGSLPFVVRAILFDKGKGANWKVVWHQDLTVAVDARHEAPGFGPWSIKEHVLHVRAPEAVLARMLAVRIHLDPCGHDNGALRVLPGSHLMGRLSAREVDQRRRSTSVTCAADAGDVMFMRPLLLHASSAALHPDRRRVIHLELSAEALPLPLNWKECRAFNSERGSRAAN